MCLFCIPVLSDEEGGEELPRPIHHPSILELFVQGYEASKDLDIPWKAQVPLWLGKTVSNFLASLLTLYLLWLIFFRPYKVHPNVDAAVLAAFDLVTSGSDDTTTLAYDLALNVTFFNDHRVYSIRFDHLTAGLYYNGTKLGPAAASDNASDDHGDRLLPSSFTQRPRRHRTVYPVLRGTASNVSAAAAEEFAREKAKGSFTVDVVVRTTLTYKFWPTRAVYYYEYNCWLLLPDPAKASGTLPVTRGASCGVAK